MAGKPGMKMPADTTSIRQMLWRSMRIMQTFTISGLMRTIPEEFNCTYDNVQKFVTRLVKAKYVAKVGSYTGGRAGAAQGYRLINNIGPIMPVLNIGRVRKPQADEQTDTDRETQTDTDTERGAP